MIMSERSMKENMQGFAIKKALRYLDEEPDKSLPKLLAWVDRFDVNNRFAKHRQVFHQIHGRCIIPFSSNIHNSASRFYGYR